MGLVRLAWVAFATLVFGGTQEAPVRYVHSLFAGRGRGPKFDEVCMFEQRNGQDHLSPALASC